MSILSVIGAGGMAAASQAQMEAATSNTVGGTPLNTNWHPGVAKAWIEAVGNGTSISVSWNITSITDTGTGTLDVTIATDFSSDRYVICCTCVSGTQRTHVITTQSAGAFQAKYFSTVDGATLGDPTYWMFACFGDQA